MTETVDRNKLGEQIRKARASLRSQGGDSTLRFSVSMNHGLQTTNSRVVSEALCALWNAVPELLGIEL